MKSLLLTLFLICYASIVYATPPLHNLEGEWLYQDGDDIEWKNPQHIDNTWSHVIVPKALREQGFLQNGSTGWYRLHFDWQQSVSGDIGLILGEIYDADEAWLNGHKLGEEGQIGTGIYDWINAYRKVRVYSVPISFLQSQNNVLAIRIGSLAMPGGMTSGPVGLGHEGDLLRYADTVHTQVVALELSFLVIFIIGLLATLTMLMMLDQAPPELRWLAIITAFFVVLNLDSTVLYLFELKTPAIVIASMLAFLLIPIPVGHYFQTLYSLSTKYYLWGIDALLILTIGILLIADSTSNLAWAAWFAWLLITCIIIAYIIIATVLAIRKRKPGAIFYLLAMLSLFFFTIIFTLILPDGWLAYRDNEVGMIIFFFSMLLGYMRQIQAHQQQYHELSSRVLSASDDERRWLSRELHDGIGQYLATVKIRLGLAQRKQDLSHVKYAEEQLTQAVTDMRRLVRGLHPSSLDHQTLEEAMRSTVETITSSSDVNITLHVSQCDVVGTLAQHIYRAFQECINNAVRHGEAKNIHCRLKQKRKSSVLMIVDDGKGFETENKPEIMPSDGSGFGLISLQERMTLIRGSMNIDSTKGQGTIVTLTFPQSEEK